MGNTITFHKLAEGQGMRTILRNGKPVGTARRDAGGWVGRVWGDWGQFEGRTLDALAQSLAAAYDYTEELGLPLAAIDA